MNNVLSQFSNDKRFDIYIYKDGKTKFDIEKNKIITRAKIKYIKHLFRAKRYSTEMVETMFELLTSLIKQIIMIIFISIIYKQFSCIDSFFWLKFP